MPLPRNCDRCGNRFQPEPGICKTLCINCRNHVRFINFQNMINVRLGKPKIPLNINPRRL